MDTALKIVLVSLVVSVLGLIAYVIPQDIARTDRAHELATQMGCTYIGNARDLNSVKFFQCGDDVVIKRVK